MEAYKFEATIQKNGIIQIPEMSQWAQQRVEVFIVIHPREEQEHEPPLAIETFIKRWRGFLKGHDPDQLHTQYLQEKYR